MANDVLFVLSNPVSAAREDDYNTWYNEVHGKELTALPGFKNITRYRAKTQVFLPEGGTAYRYLAMYEVDDADKALAAMAEAAPRLTMSDTPDLAGASGIMFEQIFTSKG